MLLRRFVLLTSLVATVAAPSNAGAQAAALGGLLGNATHINFYWTMAGAPNPDAKPAGKHGANGLGFELSFEIPGGTTRDRIRVITAEPPKGKSCEARFNRGDMEFATPCADTSVKAVKRTYSGGVAVYEEELEIKKFSWTDPAWQLGVGVGFTQAGAFISRNSANDIRVSLREAPSITAYATYLQKTPLSSLPFSPSPYVGIRTGLITLNAGRSYTSGGTMKFGGETFQLGPVVGVVGTFSGVDLFVEGAYMWRDFKSVEWETSAALPASLPRRLSLTGASIAAGVQFALKANAGK